jgi:small subunit ribosomal protein S6
LGRRRLAYPIQRFHEGIYQITNFSLLPEKVADLEHQLRLDEDVLRHLVIKENE